MEKDLVQLTVSLPKSLVIDLLNLTEAEQQLLDTTIDTLLREALAARRS